MLLTFIRHFWISQYGPTTQKELGEEFEKKIKNAQHAISFVSALEAAADAYIALLTPLQHPKWASFPAGTRDAINILSNHLEAVQIRSLLLAVTQHFTPQEANKSFKMFISWSVRFLIVGGGGGGKLDRYYGVRARDVSAGKITTAKGLSESMQDVIPVNRQFQEEFGKANVKSGNLARYYLRALELHGKEDNPQMLINEDPNAVNVEHILPVTPSKEWNVDSEAAAAFHKRLGNMVLLGSKQNVALGNDIFEKKKPVLAASPFTTT